MARRRRGGGCLVGLLVFVAFLVGVLVVADRVAKHYAEQALADYVAEQVPLDAPPQVEAHGFPFLTQAVRGEYDDVRVVLTGVRSDDVRVERLTADLSGVSLPLDDLTSGTVTEIPVARSRVQALLTYPDVQRLVDAQGRDVQLSPGGDGELRVATDVRLLGRTVRPSADVTVVLDGSTVLLTPQEIALEGTSLSMDVPDSVASRLVVEVPLPQLPFGQRLERVAVTPSGLQVDASGTDVVLRDPEE